MKGINIAACVFTLHYHAGRVYATTFPSESGSSPTKQWQACNADSPFIVNASSSMMWHQRNALSRFYDTFPYDVFYPVTPNNDNVENEDSYITARREQMESGTDAIVNFLRCGQPFSVLGGGYSNAGSSVVLGRRLLNMRFMDYVDAEIDGDVLHEERWDGAQDVGTIIVGAGSTAGSAIFTNDDLTDAALPVGHTRSVGISGLTLGGGFGFLTRFSGLLCDRVKSFTAIVPSSPGGKAVEVTKDNEHADLFWASCGGGGGNFAVVTQFKFNPVKVCQLIENESCIALKLHLELPATVEIIAHYQEWSLTISTRITPNLMVSNATHILIEGIFLGDRSMWKDAIEMSDATESTPISSTELLNAAREMPFHKAVKSLKDWKPNIDPSKMLQPFQGEVRTYFKYKSLFLFEPLPEEAIQILIDEAMYFADKEKRKNNFIIFEFQALGGDPGKSEGDEQYPYLSPKNMFASVPPKDTAFPHRGALHCLILKMDAKLQATGGSVTRMRAQVESIFDRIALFVKGRASYYNYIDPNLPLETPYFKNGVDQNPGITNSDKDYWIHRLREVKTKYNPHDMLSNPLGISITASANEESEMQPVYSAGPNGVGYVASRYIGPYDECVNATFQSESGTSPSQQWQTCYTDSPFIVNASACMFYHQRTALSRFYDTFPHDIFYPITPNIDNLHESKGSYTTATRDQMESGTNAIVHFLRCGHPFSVLGGGYSNAGNSVVLGRRLLNMRFMDYVDAELDEDVLYDEESWEGGQDVGTIIVGAGSTAGSAIFTSNDLTVAALPVGHTRSVGISGLTLGGGFGFLTRFSGLLCDRVKSFTAIVPITSEVKAVEVTKDNEFADLFWASCGGGGGNFAVVTQFKFNPVKVCQPIKNDDDSESCTVLKLHLELPATVETIAHYQEWSLTISTRITPNLMVKNETHILIEGIFLGDTSMWEDAVEMSDATASTPITSTDFLDAVEVLPFQEAVNSLTDWKSNINPSTKLQPFQGEERTYFKYKSLFLFEPLPEEAIQILIDEAMYYEENYLSKENIVVFEFQALGGDPGKPDEDNSRYPTWSPKNMFASVSPMDTAFPHRGARHCLILRTDVKMLVSGGLATRLLLMMESIYDKIAPLVKGRASYYNYLDPNLPFETPYFGDGVELNPGVTNSDKDYWISRLREVKSKYNPHDMLSNPLGHGTEISRPTIIDTAQVNSTGVMSNVLAPSMFVLFLTGYLLFQSTHASAIFLRHDARWRSKNE